MKYRELYEKAAGDARGALSALAEAQERAEQYRAFIHETGQQEPYLRWVAKRIGIKDADIDDVFRKDEKRIQS